MSDATSAMRAAFEEIVLPSFVGPSDDDCIDDHWQTWQEAWEVAIRLERARIVAALPGGYSVDPQWVADMVRDGNV